MFEIKVKTQFCAAHYLENYKGKCEELHGHNWKVEATVTAKKLDKIGMVIDFKELKKLLNEIVTSLDHKFLNKLPQFSKSNTTSEIIAKYIFVELKKKLVRFLGVKKAKIVKLSKVSVWEQDNSCAAYQETQKQ